MILRRLAAFAFAVLLLLAAAVAPGAGARGKLPPKIHSGRYASGDTYIDVNLKARTASYHFRVLCTDPYASQYASSGPRPKRARLTGIRVGARVDTGGEYGGNSESGFPGEELTYWGLHGHFVSPTEFRGRVGVETGTFPVPPYPEPPFSRPECLSKVRISLRLEPEAAGPPYARKR